jgi:hypothetical protein
MESDYSKEQAGIPESKKYPGHINWKVLPETLWSSGRYITGIRAAVILGSMDPTIREIREVKERTLKFGPSKTEMEKMEKALKQGKIRLLPRPNGACPSSGKGPGSDYSQIGM